MLLVFVMVPSVMMFHCGDSVRRGSFVFRASNFCTTFLGFF